MKLFTLLRLFAVCWLLTFGMAHAESGELHTAPQPLRLGITPATARGQFSLLEAWRVYLERKLNHPVEFIFRERLQDSLTLLKQKKLDFVWLSSPAYIKNKQHTRLLVSPLYQGHPYDHAYLIVPASDQHTHALSDLKGKLFAYVDSTSNTGYLEPRYQLTQAGADPDQFFKLTFFTRDHLKVIAAVAIGLADAGSVSGFAWETLALTRPDITAQTRIVSQSAAYGFPPIVARRTLSPRDFTEMQQVLLEMSQDSAGIELLHLLNLDGFTPGDDASYLRTAQMMQRMGE